ncbi:jg11249 [Pararge aegeria aegeria]|uniref:Jg11249 protein n=1 Tax=Pararge aegeria aegeria TaxID=348720 RepID=A0A8S4RL58_9NEOP|nr:jg11249 [Pararge aegeria aegeria]
MLDVTFPPEVSIIGADASSLASLEEGSSALTLECRADGNPSPYVWWTKDGQVIGTNGPKLIRAPISRNDSGIYGCQARNSLGTSDSVKIEIDVKFPPRVTWVGPDTVVEANLFSEVTLECKADGNPSPSYQWYHNPNLSALSGHLEDGYPISSTPQLLLHNVSYTQHGRYTCIASNHIGLEERSHQSEAITLNVLGPPVGEPMTTAHAWSGTEGRVQASVCADPPPRRAAWLWGSLRLDVPSHVGRYKTLEPTNINGCYRYTLLISSTSLSDARVYVLHVENERGFSSHSVALTVHENFSLTETAHVAPLIAAALLIAALLVIVLCLIVRCKRRRESVEYKTDDLDSEKTVLPADAVYSPRDQPRASARVGTVAERAGPGTGARYSPGALQAALSALEQEAKENVYAVLDPHIQYELTINKHGEPPKYLSLSKPLTNQRTHAFDPQNINEINNNYYGNENRLPNETDPRIRKSDRSYKKNNKNQKSYSCKSNQDVKYSIDPYFGMVRASKNNNVFRAQNVRDNARSSFKDQSRMFERNNSAKKSVAKNYEECEYSIKTDVKRASDRSRGKTVGVHRGTIQEYGKEFEDFNEESKVQEVKIENDTMPRPGKVKELASRFNRKSAENNRQSVIVNVERPKTLESFDKAYLNHVFPDAIEI